MASPQDRPPARRVTATPAALAALARLREQRGAVLLYQSGVGEGEPEGFSLAAGDGRQFVTRSRVFSPAELAALPMIPATEKETT